MNKVIMIGNLTADPVLGHTQGGKAYCNFSLAVSRQFSKEEVDFVNCTAWEKTAEVITEYCRKGSRVAVDGSLRVEKKNDNGKNMTFTKVLVSSIEFLNSKKQENTKTDAEPSSKKGEFEESDNFASNEVEDDDFPF